MNHTFRVNRISYLRLTSSWLLFVVLCSILVGCGLADSRIPTNVVHEQDSGRKRDSVLIDSVQGHYLSYIEMGESQSYSDSGVVNNGEVVILDTALFRLSNKKQTIRQIKSRMKWKEIDVYLSDSAFVIWHQADPWSAAEREIVNTEYLGTWR